MFIKAFKLKSNVQLKASDCKKLKQRIQQQFPAISDTNLLNLFPNKSTITLIKIITYSGTLVNVYSVDKRPMFFDEDATEENKLIPTLYSLWLLFGTDLIPFFTTHPQVLPRLANGADLMLPGVIRTGTGLNSYGNYKRDQLVAVNLTSNKAAVGVGRLMRSSEDLYMSGGHGPCVKLLHIFGDKLWGIESSVAQQVPNLQAVISLPTDDDFPALGVSSKSARKNKENLIEEISANEDGSELDDSQLEIKFEEIQVSENSENLSVQSSAEEKMDDILKIAFLTALKTNSKNLQLPILTSNFFRNFIIPASRKEINLKQTTYKKLSKFLDKMSDEGFVVVREETKGVEKLISVDYDHPEFVNFIIPDGTEKIDPEMNKQQQLFHVEMTELYLVTDDTIKFFTKFNFQKGEGIRAVQIKKILKEYVGKYQLPYTTPQRKVIKLDECLSEICDHQSESTLDDCYSMLLSKMHHSFEMRGKHEVSANKPPIQMSLATRSGNKKVTLVTNLEYYGIILSEFSKACKQGAAASTSIIKSPNQKQDVFQIQGNQVKFLHKILTQTYKISEKNIHGMDLAKKEKKKK